MSCSHGGNDPTFCAGCLRALLATELHAELVAERDVLAMRVKALEDARGLDKIAASAAVESWKSTLNMYAQAWWRELRGPYRNKHHEIDALVLTTRERLQELDDARAERDASRREAAALRDLFESVLLFVKSHIGQQARMYERAIENAIARTPGAGISAETLALAKRGEKGAT